MRIHDFECPTHGVFQAETDGVAYVRPCPLCGEHAEWLPPRVFMEIDSLNERAIRDYENVLGVRVETKQALREHVSRHRLMENERIRYESNRERVERQLSRSAVERVRIDAIRKVMQE